MKNTKTSSDAGSKCHCGVNKKSTLMVALLGVLITTALVASATSAAPDTHNKKYKQMYSNVKTAIESGNYADLGDDPKISEEKFNAILEKHNAFKNALENNDYSLLGENPKISAEDFSKVAAAYQTNGFEGVKEIKRELGLKKEFKKGHKRKFHKEKMENFHEAIENNDYSLLGDDPKVSAENFSKMVAAYAENGFEGVKEVKKELGIFKGHRLKHRAQN